MPPRRRVVAHLESVDRYVMLKAANCVCVYDVVSVRESKVSGSFSECSWHRDTLLMCAPDYVHIWKGGSSWRYKAPLRNAAILGLSLDCGLLFWSSGQTLHVSPLSLVEDAASSLHADMVASKGILRKINSTCRVFFDTLREEIGSARGTPGQLLLTFEEKAPVISCSMNYTHRQEMKKLHRQLDERLSGHDSLEILNVRRHMQHVWEEFDALLGLRYDQRADILRALRFMQKDPLHAVTAKMDHLLRHAQLDAACQELGVVFETSMLAGCPSVQGKRLSSGHVLSTIGDCLQFESFGPKLISASSSSK